MTDDERPSLRHELWEYARIMLIVLAVAAASMSGVIRLTKLLGIAIGMAGFCALLLMLQIGWFTWQTYRWKLREWERRQEWEREMEKLRR